MVRKYISKRNPPEPPLQDFRPPWQLDGGLGPFLNHISVLLDQHPMTLKDIYSEYIDWSLLPQQHYIRHGEAPTKREIIRRLETRGYQKYCSNGSWKLRLPSIGLQPTALISRRLRP